ncbi:serine/threonine-protein kinase [Nonomuraea sp. NPDC050394]|uniref:serine/threonine-protein kinase n=1 Tax=Nonomuraea sp. NPDC050394 TaxID=3364363 RepID=UPI0037BC20AB
MSESAGIVGGRYRLLRTIGKGGMGTVWQAHDEVLGRDVAVKEIQPPPDLSGPERELFTVRTFREARAAGRVAHPGVATVYDVLEEHGHPWIIMQLVPSRTLGETVREEGALPPVQTAAIGLQLMQALRAAHAAGVLHRDVKPDNVLLTDDGRAVLTDFGIATTEDDASLTRTGVLVGTPAFIAPERAAGGTARPAADLWSLGVTLYVAVEGHSPFQRGHALATLGAVMHDPPGPLSKAGPLGPVILGLLEKNPADRLTAEDTERHLHAITTGLAPEPTIPIPPIPGTGAADPGDAGAGGAGSRGAGIPGAGIPGAGVAGAGAGMSGAGVAGAGVVGAGMGGSDGAGMSGAGLEGAGLAGAGAGAGAGAAGAGMGGAGAAGSGMGGAGVAGAGVAAGYGGPGAGGAGGGGGGRDGRGSGRHGRGKGRAGRVAALSGLVLAAGLVTGGVAWWSERDVATRTPSTPVVKSTPTGDPSPSDTPPPSSAPPTESPVRQSPTTRPTTQPTTKAPDPDRTPTKKPTPTRSATEKGEDDKPGEVDPSENGDDKGGKNKQDERGPASRGPAERGPAERGSRLRRRNGTN